MQRIGWCNTHGRSGIAIIRWLTQWTHFGWTAPFGVNMTHAQVEFASWYLFSISRNGGVRSGRQAIEDAGWRAHRHPNGSTDLLSRTVCSDGSFYCYPTSNAPTTGGHERLQSATGPWAKGPYANAKNPAKGDAVRCALNTRMRSLSSISPPIISSSPDVLLSTMLLPAMTCCSTGAGLSL